MRGITNATYTDYMNRIHEITNEYKERQVRHKVDFKLSLNEHDSFYNCMVVDSSEIRNLYFDKEHHYMIEDVLPVHLAKKALKMVDEIKGI